MKKGKRISIIVCLLSVLFLVNTAFAELFNRGTDSAGNQLIYDSDFNITWYDYTTSWDIWQNQMNWASALSVSGGDLVGVYDDWRLPTALNQNGTGPCKGDNCTGSEMGHLYYTELGNTSWPQPPYLTNKGDFQHLQVSAYWVGTEYAANTSNAWGFDTSSGGQNPDRKDSDGSAIAVRSGDVAVVPEPISSILFITGGAVLAGRRYLRRRRKNS